MKVLVIDSQKSGNSGAQCNLHWKNARLISDILGGDLIWSYPKVNDKILGGYDKIIFVHASHYSYTDYAWLEASPNAELFYVTNEYNLGEPRTLWTAAKSGRKYTVIANHPAAISKVVKKYVKEWHVTNLNALSYDPIPVQQDGGACGCVYYGSYRDGRKKYMGLYFHSPLIVSTHTKNITKMRNAGATCRFVGRIQWGGAVGLHSFAASLYLEDEITHQHYNYPANRFYESLNHSCPILVDENCLSTFETAGYEIPEDIIVRCIGDIARKTEGAKILDGWREGAAMEKSSAMSDIASIVR